ncbi:MAG: VWA domain-containing protein [Thermoanaerobaculia bacterium]|nr:VWA domain-containing protein [Thermoanaerobaculia bacterium]
MFPSRRSLLSLLLLGAFLASAGSAQEPASPPVFGELLEVEVVNVDVFVTDRDGQPVVGLTKDDFELLADGKPVPIEFFSAPPPGASFVPYPGTPGTLPEEGVAPPPARPTLVVYVDNLNLTGGRRNEALRHLEGLIEDRMKTGHRAMVAVFDRSLRILTPVTDDLRAVRGAFAEIARTTPRAAQRQAQEQRLKLDLEQITPADFVPALVEQIEWFAQEEAQDTRQALIALTDLMGTLAGVEGAKVVFLVSGGVSTEPGRTLWDAFDRRYGGTFGSQGDRRRAGDLDADYVRRELVKVTRAAQASRALIYAVDAGVRGPIMDAGEVGSEIASGGTPGEFAQVEASSNIGSIADRSGGRRLLSGPDLPDTLGTVAREIASAYSLGFTPAPDRADRMRDITVRVKQEGLRVRHRDGYWRRTSDQQLADTALAAASLGGADNPLGALLEVSVGERAGRRKEREVKALVRLPVPSLTLMPNGNGHAGKLAFEFAVRDEEGRVSRFEKREQTFSIPAEKLAAAAKQSIAYGIEMHLAPGSYTLATAVLDAVGGVRSTATIGFRVEK